MVKKRSRTSKDIEPPEANDLKLINGIGPAVEARLHGVGIFTFAQLAALSPADIAAAVADLAGLTAERIIKQDWTGQARKLASIATLTGPQMGTETLEGSQEDVTSTDQPQKGVEVPAHHQHQATFTVELLLNEDNEVLSTEIVHVQSRHKDTLVGWQTELLIGFLVQYAALRLPSVEPVPPVAAVIEPAPEIVVETEPTLPIPATTGPISVLHLRELETVLPGTDSHRAILPNSQPFDVHLTLDFTDVVVPGDAMFNYTASIYAKNLVGHTRQTIGEAQDTILPTDKVTINVKGSALPPGTYRLEAVATLTLSTMESASQPDLKALIKDGLLQVY